MPTALRYQRAALNAYASDGPLEASLVRMLNLAAPAVTVASQVISGDSREDVLLEDFNARLNSTDVPGTAVTVTYSFAALLPAAYRGDNTFGWRRFQRPGHTGS